MRTLAFVSAKGGTGKTAIASSFATVFARAGIRVALVDGDESTSGLSLLLYRHIKRQQSASDAADGISQVPTFEVEPGLNFFPTASPHLEGSFNIGGHASLESLLAELQHFGEHDLCIVDLAAGFSERGQRVAQAADKVIVVTEFDPMSELGVRRLLQQYFNDDTHVLVNKLLPELAQLPSLYFEAFNHLPPIPFDFDVMRSYSSGQIPLVAHPDSAFALGLIKAAQAALPEFRTELSKYVESLAAPLRSDATERIDKLNEEISRAQGRIVDLREERRMTAHNVRTAGTLSGVGVSTMGLFARFGGTISALVMVVTAILFATLWINQGQVPREPSQLIPVGAGVVAAVYAVGLSYLAKFRYARVVNSDIPFERRRVDRLMLLERETHNRLKHLLEERDSLSTMLDASAEDLIKAKSAPDN